MSAPPPPPAPPYPRAPRHKDPNINRPVPHILGRKSRAAHRSLGGAGGRAPPEGSAGCAVAAALSGSHQSCVGMSEARGGGPLGRGGRLKGGGRGRGGSRDGGRRGMEVGRENHHSFLRRVNH